METVAELMRFKVTVSTHDLLQEGVTEAPLIGTGQDYYDVLIAGDDFHEARLFVMQAATRFGMVTGCYAVI